MSKAKISGTYLRLTDGREIRLTLKKLSAKNINPPPATRQGRFVMVELPDGSLAKKFEPVYNASLPIFRPDAALRLLKMSGFEITVQLLKYLGYKPYCRRCGRSQETLGSEAPRGADFEDAFGKVFELRTIGDGSTLCPICFAVASDEDWDALPEDQVFELEPPIVPDDIVMIFADEAIKLWKEYKSDTAPEIPDEVMKRFAGIATKRFHGITQINLQGLQSVPLKSYSRAKTTEDAEVIGKDAWKDWLVKGSEPTGEEILEEFPYLRKTHFLDVNKDTLKPVIYWDQFKVLGRGSYYEAAAKDDAGRFALWDLAQKCMNGNHIFPDGTKGEAMIVNTGYHATSGTKQEYIVLLRPVVYVNEQGEQKFVWLIKTCQSRIAFSAGMDIPREGERPVTVPARQTLMAQSFEDMIAGLIKP